MNRFPRTLLFALVLVMSLPGCALQYVARDAAEAIRAASQQKRPDPTPTDSAEVTRRVRAAARQEKLDLTRIAEWRSSLHALPDVPNAAQVADLVKPSSGSDLSALLPFEITPEVAAFALRNTRTAVTVGQQIGGLISGIYAVGQFDQQYEAGRTGTAAETLATGRGNCFAFTNLFVAAARSIGLKAFYLDATRSNSHLRNDGVRLILSGHIVAGVMTPTGGVVIDFYRLQKDKETFWYTRLSDLEVTALFVNNLGYEAMKYGADATPYFRTAVALAPQLESPWNNLAVLLMTSGRTDEAEAILETAVSSKVGSFAPYFNLGLLYMKEGHYTEAETVFRQAYWRRRDNPFLFYQLGLSYLHQGKRDKAKRAFEKALRLDRTMIAARTKLDRLAGR